MFPCTNVYDDLARASSVNCVNGSTDIWNQAFTFDAFGNISKSGNSSFAASYLLSNGSTNNQEQSVSSCIPTYDAIGDLTKDCTFLTPYTYVWNIYGNPVTLNNVTLTYDALDREVESFNGSKYTQVLYSPIGKLGLMNGQSASSIRIPLPGGSAMEMLGPTGGTTHILHSDWLGSARLSTNFGGRNLAYDTGYAPYGENYAGSGGATGDLNFTGQRQDTLSGLYDFLYREYNPVQGRWIKPDPAALSAVDMSDPQSWNRYAYVNNSPLDSTDPQGLWEFSTWLAGLGYTQLAAADLQVPQGIQWGSNWNEFDLLNIPVRASTFTPPQPISTPITNINNQYGTAVSATLYIPGGWSYTVIGTGFDLLSTSAANNRPDLPTLDARANALAEAINKTGVQTLKNPCTAGAFYGASVTTVALPVAGISNVAAIPAEGGFFPELLEASQTVGKWLAPLPAAAASAWQWAKQKVTSGCNSMQGQ